MSKLKYDESSIQVLEGLEAVKKRPGMYIGSTDNRGLHHMVWEIVDNAIDEALAGFGDHIVVKIHKDGSLSVRDFARGIPVGKNKQTGLSTVETIFTVLHAGGKFGEGGYKTSGGLHGVGASVVNALSEWVNVNVYKDGSEYEIQFEKGGKTKKALRKVGKTKETGTLVSFKPDAKIFSTTDFNFSIISEHMQESAFLIKGIKMELIDEREEDKSVSFQYENGVEAYIDFINEDRKTLHDVIYFSGESNEIEAEIAFQFTESYNETITSFVNNVRTKDGGTHETSFKTAFTRVINEYAKNAGILKAKDKKLEGSDIREGLTAIISCRIPEKYLQFEGQTKSKLGTPQARGAVDAVVGEQLMYFLNENSTTSKKIIEKMKKAQQVREAARKARLEARNGKGRGKKENALSGKLTPAQSKNKKKNELFLVEGDSAGGSAKQGRDRKFQAILPLRGKVINTERAKLEDIFKNEEVNTVIHTVGAGVGGDFNLDDVNYDKVIIMTDADTDGAHIQVLLLTFFYRYMKPLIEAGKVYIALPPLYKVSKGRGKKEVIEYVWMDEELEDACKKVGKGYMIQRYKGLGEMNADQLWETTMDPKTRTLIQVNIDDAAIAERRVSILMGDKVPPRREWIENNVAFSLEDEFDVLKGGL